jgi:hypothetical protein
MILATDQVQVRVCLDADVNEAAEPKPEPKVRLTVRGQVAEIWSIATMARLQMLNYEKLYGPNTLSGVWALVRYGADYTGRGGKRRIPVDVPKMIKDWADWIAVYSTAHDKKAVDEIEFNIDALLSPLLTAPVRQVRQFYNGLVKALQEDPRIPFFVWQWFSAWGKVVIEPAENDEAIIRLKKKLASDIADLVEKQEVVKLDLHNALVGALQWRSAESLQEIKEDLKAGAKPRIKGRQSCLFLTTKRRGRNQKEHTVML